MNRRPDSEIATCLAARLYASKTVREDYAASITGWDEESYVTYCALLAVAEEGLIGGDTYTPEDIRRVRVTSEAVVKLCKIED